MLSQQARMLGLTYLAILILIVDGAFALAVKAAQSSQRPNVVFILVDDLRHDGMSCAGHPFARTPNIDRIATGGLRFSNAFAVSALCAPSRATFLTGQYGHTNGVRTNEEEEFDHSLPTFPGLLRQNGYETAFIGKWHMKPVATPRPGFDFWLSFTGQGGYEDPKLNENGRDFEAQGYMTDILTQYAVDFLKKPREKPFCLCLWHKAVHGPFTPADRHKDLYADAKLPEPPSFKDTFTGKPEWQRALASKKMRKNNPNAPIPASVPPDNWDGRNKNYIDYYRALAAVDDSVGRILETLKETGTLNNTLIIFAGDNGFFHGEHRRSDKRYAYEESMRIPLLMCGVGITNPGRLVEQMTVNIDIAPTLLDLAGIKPLDSMQGMSLKPLLEGASPSWRSSFLYEYFREEWLPVIPTMVAVRTQDWKYVRYPTLKDLDELYDLQSDPYEMRNLAADPAAKRKLAEMRGELERLMKETRYSASSTAPASR